MKATRKTTSRKSARTNGSASGKKWKRDQDKACSPGARGTLPVAGLEEVELPHRHLLARGGRGIVRAAAGGRVRAGGGEGGRRGRGGRARGRAAHAQGGDEAARRPEGDGRATGAARPVSPALGRSARRHGRLDSARVRGGG